MDILRMEILDNPLRNYLIIIGIVIFIRLFHIFLARPVALGLFFIINHFWKQVEKKAFIELIARPLGWYITLAAAIIAISNLHYPTAWNIIWYGIPLKIISGKILVLATILSTGWFLSKLVNFTALVMEKKARTTQDTRDDQLIVFFRDLLKVCLAIATLFIVVRYVFEKNISSLLTGLSIIGAALALAAKETIENLIGSFIIFFDEPFKTGDHVKVGSVSGNIEHIGLRSTRIRTIEKTLVTVPNKQMVDSLVDNLTDRTGRRAEIRLDLGIQTATSKLSELKNKLSAFLAAHPKLTKSTVFFSDFSKGGKTLVVEFFTGVCPMDEFNSIKEEINISLSKMTEDLNIDMASGTSVTIVSDSGNLNPPASTII